MTTIKDLARILVSQHRIKGEDAELFISQFVEIINEGLIADRQVKIKGFGTFKLQTVKERSSVSVSTGERVTINEHDKITFTPDNVLRDMVNKPFAQFETVIIDDEAMLDESLDELNSMTTVNSEVDGSEETKYDVQETSENNKEQEIVNEEIEEIVVKEEQQEEGMVEPVELVTPIANNDIVEDNINTNDIEARDENQNIEEISSPETVEEQDESINVKEENLDKDIENGEEEEENPSGDNTIVPLMNTSEEDDTEGKDNEDTEEQEADEEEKNVNIEESESEDESEEKNAIEEEEEEEKNDDEEDDDDDEDEEDEDEDDDEEYYYENDHSPMFYYMVGGAIGAVLFFLIGYYAGANSWFGSWFGGNDKNAPQTEMMDSTMQNNANSNVEDSVRNDSIKKTDEQENLSQNDNKENDKSEIKETENSQSSMDDYNKKDVRVRTGAWVIVGTKKEVKVKEGQTLASISKSYLGPDMECYVEVYNNKKSVRAGDIIKIPELKLKKKRK